MLPNPPTFVIELARVFFFKEDWLIISIMHPFAFRKYVSIY
jgi:hypothetical protein